MTRKLILTRDEGEALVDILDACPDAPYAYELNREIRYIFGMAPIEGDPNPITREEWEAGKRLADEISKLFAT